MSNQAQGFTSLFRNTVSSAAIAVLITFAALSLPAQNTVPASASQAARMPQFASRLAHPAKGRMPAKPPVGSYSHRHLPPGQQQVAYDNGPVNGQVDAWVINFGFAVTNSIQVSNDTTLTSMNFYAWLIPGDTITNVEVSIGSQPYGTDLFDGFIGPIELTLRLGCDAERF